MVTTIRRDPFARFDTVRRIVKHNGEKRCVCCWSKGRELARGYSLFQYGTHADDKPFPEFRDFLFCSVGCAESYNA